MSFDPRCYDLAEYFMPKNSAEHREALAEHIQGCIEDWLIGFNDVAEASSPKEGQKTYMDTSGLNTYRNRNFVKRDYECTNVVYCLAPSAPSEEWVISQDAIPASMRMLERRGDALFYGWM